MPEQETQPLLRVRLTQADMSLGELALLLQNIQIALRSAARAIDRRPADRSLKAVRFEEGSIQFLVEAIGWVPEVARLVSAGVIDVTGAVLTHGGVSVGLVIFLRYMDQRKQRRHEELESRRHEELAGRLERLESHPYQLQLNIEAEEIAALTDYTAEQVQAAISTYDAIERVVDGVGRSGGGFLEAVATDERVKIPKGFHVRHPLRAGRRR